MFLFINKPYFQLNWKSIFIWGVNIYSRVYMNLAMFNLYLG